MKLCSSLVVPALVACIAAIVGVSSPRLAGEAFTRAVVNHTVPDDLTGVNVVVTGG